VRSIAWLSLTVPSVSSAREACGWESCSKRSGLSALDTSSTICNLKQRHIIIKVNALKIIENDTYYKLFYCHTPCPTLKPSKNILVHTYQCLIHVYMYLYVGSVQFLYIILYIYIQCMYELDIHVLLPLAMPLNPSSLGPLCQTQG